MASSFSNAEILHVGLDFRLHVGCLGLLEHSVEIARVVDVVGVVQVASIVNLLSTHCLEFLHLLLLLSIGIQNIESVWNKSRTLNVLTNFMNIRFLTSCEVTVVREPEVIDLGDKGVGRARKFDGFLNVHLIYLEGLFQSWTRFLSRILKNKKI